MDKRQGLMAGYRRLGRIQRFIVLLTVCGFLFGIHSCFFGATKEGQKQTHDQLAEINKSLKGDNQELVKPYLIVQMASPKLLLDKEGKSWLPYILINNGGMTAYNIRKGHRIFNEKKECTKHYYDITDQYLLDLVPGEKSPIHTDNLEKLVIEGNGLDEKFFKLQLIITYTKSKDENDTLYYSLVNLVLKPISCKEGYCNEFIITRPSTRIGSMDKFIDECKEFNGK